MTRIARILGILTFLLITTVLQISAESISNVTHVIDEIEYKIDGTTKEKALRALSELEDGMEFDSYEAMKIEVEREKQNLINRRVFDSVRYELKYLENENEIDHYVVTFIIVDAFTIVPIPYPKYDSNTGLRLGLKLYWDNFLGTMTNSYLGMNIDIRQNDKTGKWETGEWMINPSITGIRLTKDIFLSAGFVQSYNEEDFIDDITPENSYDYAYYSTGISVSTSFDLSKDRSDIYRGYSISTGLNFRYNYTGTLGSNFEQPYAISFSHGFSLGRTDWINNFRKGFNIGISNANRIGESDGFFLISSVDTSARYYFPFLKRFNFYTRAMAFYQWGEPRRLGPYLRGVRDNLMSGYTGLTLNTSLAFQFWRFENVWDAQIHPFLDIGITYNNESFDAYRDFNIGFGADLVLYLDALPSLVAVGSIGFDPKRFDSDDLFGSMEITISSSLFY